jgi:hypothetical protein
MLTKIWQWLDGRKRDISAIALLILVWLTAQHIIDQSTQVLIAGILSVWTAGAFIHAGVKGDL